MDEVTIQVTLERKEEKPLCLKLILKIEGDVIKRISAEQVPTPEDIALSN